MLAALPGGRRFTQFRCLCVNRCRDSDQSELGQDREISLVQEAVTIMLYPCLAGCCSACCAPCWSGQAATQPASGGSAAAAASEPTVGPAPPAATKPLPSRPDCEAQVAAEVPSGESVGLVSAAAMLGGARGLETSPFRSRCEGAGCQEHRCKTVAT